MKKVIIISASLFLIIILFVSCKKENADTPGSLGQVINSKPVAKAGVDITVSRKSCNDTIITTELNGNGSFDPNNNIVSYKWAYVSGPAGAVIKNNSLAVTNAESLVPGVYAFELTVTDNGGLFSKDTVVITVLNVLIEYDLDITINIPYFFYNNYNAPEDPPNLYYDQTVIFGKTLFPPLGEFSITLWETTDSAELSNTIIESGMRIRSTFPTINNPIYDVSGAFGGVNFKQLIRQGGGSFTGTFTVNFGSAKRCDGNAYINLPPLIITGTLNTTTHMVNLKIKGKAIF